MFFCYQGARTWQPLPVLVFGTMAVIGALLTCLLPETLNTRLPDTVKEAELLRTESVKGSNKQQCGEEREKKEKEGIVINGDNHTNRNNEKTICPVDV